LCQAILETLWGDGGASLLFLAALPASEFALDESDIDLERLFSRCCGLFSSGLVDLNLVMRSSWVVLQSSGVVLRSCSVASPSCAPEPRSVLAAWTTSIVRGGFVIGNNTFERVGDTFFGGWSHSELFFSFKGLAILTGLPPKPR
jgi:hypothetical protein